MYYVFGIPIITYLQLHIYNSNNLFHQIIHFMCYATLAVHLESQSHARNVTSLQSELERERLAHQEAMLNLSAGTCLHMCS